MRALAAFLLPLALPAQDSRIRLTFDPSEAEAALAIVELNAAGKPVPEAAWTRLFDSEPYRRLKVREASLKRDFTDAEFRAFLLSPDLAARAPALRATLEAWTRAPLETSARRILPYLPTQATVRASIYPMVKPRDNTFVFDVRTRPTLFLYLDPAVGAAEFDNTVAHEMHHFGFSSLADAQDARLKALPEAARTAAEWTGAFGEGFAMLAAAGGPDVHPHAASGPKTRARWDADMARHNANLKALEAFFLGVVQGRTSAAAAREAAMGFFGEQGPWYTVGYRMAVLVERHAGRAALLACMEDPPRILAAYNAAAEAENRKGGEALALWPQALIQALQPGVQTKGKAP